MALSPCNSTAGSDGRELLQHGTIDFPIACYYDDLAAAEVPWHWHDELEAAIVTEGSAVVRTGSRKYIIQAGEAFFINAQVLHGCWDLDHSGSRLHSIAFHPRLVSGSPDSIFHSKYVRPLIENKALASLHLTPDIPWQQECIRAVESAWQACAQEPDGFELKARSALSDMVLLLQQNMPSIQREPSARSLRSAERIKQMLQYIQDHYAEELDTRSIARSAAISESECLRCFRTEIGATPIQYLRRLRIQRAAQLLVSTENKISDIASMCGFQDMSYFTKTFREMKGCAPSGYRRRESIEKMH